MTKAVLGVVCTVLVCVSISAAGTVAPGARVVSQTSNSTTIEFTSPGPKVESVRIGDQSFSVVTLPGCDASMPEVGKPQVPMTAMLLAIPTGAMATLSVVQTEVETLHIARVVPVQPESLRDNPAAEPVIDANCYGQEASYPGALACVERPAVWRDLQVASVKLYPVQVNQAHGEVVVYRRMVVQGYRGHNT